MHQGKGYPPGRLHAGAPFPALQGVLMGGQGGTIDPQRAPARRTTQNEPVAQSRGGLVSANISESNFFQELLSFHTPWNRLGRGWLALCEDVARVRGKC